MIKKIKELDASELGSFKEKYFEYFQDLAVMKNRSSAVASIKKELLKSRSASYVDTMVDRINKGERYGYAEVSDDVVFGFIVGRIYENENMGWISHLYIDPSMTPVQKRVCVLEMYKALVNDFKKAGVEKISSETSNFSPKEVDLLETLGFSREEEYSDDSVLYEKKL